MASDGTVYVAIHDPVKIKKYDPNGDWVMDIGGNYADDDLSGDAAGISVYPGFGYFDVSEDGSDLSIYANYRVKRYTSTGAWIVTIGNGTYGAGNYLG